MKINHFNKVFFYANEVLAKLTCTGMTLIIPLSLPCGTLKVSLLSYIKTFKISFCMKYNLVCFQRFYFCYF